MIWRSVCSRCLESIPKNCFWCFSEPVVLTTRSCKSEDISWFTQILEPCVSLRLIYSVLAKHYLLIEALCKLSLISWQGEEVALNKETVLDLWYKRYAEGRIVARTESVGETVHVGVTVSSESLAWCVGSSGCFLHVDEGFWRMRAKEKEA